MPGGRGLGAGSSGGRRRARTAPGYPRLAEAYAWLANSVGETDGVVAGAEWAERALQLAEDVGDTETALEARRIRVRLPDGRLEAMEQVLEDAQRANWLNS